MVNRLDDNREFKDSVLGMIPKDWDVWNIEEIIDNIIDFRGKTPLKIGMTWGGGDIPALSANNVEMGKINLEKETNYGSEALYKKWMNKGDTKKGDIIITMEAPLGNIAQIPDNKKYILSQRVLLFKTKKYLIYNDFFKNFLLSDLFQNRLKSYSSGTTATGIQQSKLLKLPIIVPPIPEQQQIAKILDTVDKAIAQTETLIAKYKRVKTGLMQDLLTRGIDENGQMRDRTTHKFKRSPLGMIPDEWDVITIKDIATDVTDGDHHTPQRSESGIFLLSARNILNGYLSLDDVDFIPESEYKRMIKRCHPEYGDILISCSGTIGRVCEVPKNLLCALVRSAALIKLDRNLCFSPFIALVLQSAILQKQILAEQQQAAQPNLFQGSINRLQLALPRLIQEQITISNSINKYDNLIYQEQLYVYKLKLQKTGLMQDLLTGKTSVKPLLKNQP